MAYIHTYDLIKDCLNRKTYLMKGYKAIDSLYDFYNNNQNMAFQEFVFNYNCTNV